MSVDARGTIGKLRATFDSGRTRPASWRHEQIAGLRRLLEEGEAELVQALKTDLGRPLTEAYGADIGHAKGELRHLAKHLDKWMKPRKVGVGMLVAPATGSVTPEPLGVVLCIGPWNYPVQLIVEPLAAALGAGNCAVVKPSELAPATSAVLARLLPRYVDGDAVAVVEGGVEETTALLEERFDHIFFTGSTAVGRVVAQAAAKHLTPVTLELGGKSPCYVHSSADLDVTAKRIVWGKFLNAGQTCIAPDYVLVDRATREPLVAALRSTIEAAYGTDPKSSPSYGRIVNERHLSRLRGLLEGEGAGDVVVGGQIDEADRFVAPTIVLEPSPESALMKEEIFGPVLPVLAVDGPDAVVDFVNARPKPLALYAFAEDGSPAVDSVVERTSSGGVCVNHTLMHILPPGLPFGGVGDSGQGAYHGQYGFDTFSHLKPVLRKRVKPDLKLLYPPYTRMTERLVKKMLR